MYALIRRPSSGIRNQTLVSGRPLAVLVLMAALILSGAPAGHAEEQAPGGAQAPLVNSIGLETGVAKAITFPAPPRSIIIGDPTIADVLLVGEKIGVIFPKKIGVTRMVAFGKHGELIGQYNLPVGAPTTISVWRDGTPSRLWCSETACLSDGDIKQQNSVAPTGQIININPPGQPPVFAPSSADASNGSGGLSSKTVSKSTTTTETGSGN